MLIRGKLLILLLVIALIPLTVSAVLNHLSLRRLGDRLTGDTRDILSNTATQYLLGRVADYRRILQRDQEALLLALDFQASEVEERLGAPSPKEAPVYFAAQFDQGKNPPPGLAPSDRHFRRSGDGQAEPMPISYREQVILLVGDPAAPRLADDLKRLSTMTEAYQRINRVRPRLFFWQYTALQTGIHSSYPGHGGYPAGYDPRRRSWYQRAEESGEVSRLVVTDATTGKPLLTLSKPVHRPDGSFAGVTAIDVSYDRLFTDWELPERWQPRSESMVAMTEPDGAGGMRIQILLRDRLPGSREDWESPPRQEFLESPDTLALNRIGSDLEAGRSGVRKLSWRGQDSLVAYSPAMAGEPFPLLIVPLDLVQAPADRVESYFRSRIYQFLEYSALILLASVVWVFITAFRRSRSVTRPIKDLARAAGSLAKGQFDIQVDIRTGDELQELGETFNRVGPQLKERQRIKQALEVAKEIQQMLLPTGAPKLPGFDIAGRTVYCEETGGDYFDYITVDDQRLAIAVGDVSGHGIGPALLMAAARGLLRSQAPRHGLAPDRLLDDLNQHFVKDTADDLFMTLFYGIIDHQSRDFHWVSAGHGPAYHYHHQSGTFLELPSTGIPLGIIRTARYATSGPAALLPGDLLLIGTDGIWEAPGPGGAMFGIERFKEVVAENAAASASDLLAAVLQAVTRFRGQVPQTDDLTLVVIKV